MTAPGLGIQCPCGRGVSFKEMADRGDAACPACGYSFPAEARRLAEVRAGVGSEVAHCRFPDHAAAGRAFDAIEKAAKGISAWRHTSDRTGTWYVTALGEERNRRMVAGALALMRAAGGVPEAGPVEVLDALRERRWQTQIRAVLAGKTDGVRQSARYGLGARLGLDGVMRPHRRPQG